MPDVVFDKLPALLALFAIPPAINCCSVANKSCAACGDALAAADPPEAAPVEAAALAGVVREPDACGL